MVRLLLFSGYLPLPLHIRFNPTMVRLLPLAELTARAVIGGFNPTMVRLLLCLLGEFLFRN